MRRAIVYAAFVAGVLALEVHAAAVLRVAVAVVVLALFATLIVAAVSWLVQDYGPAARRRRRRAGYLDPQALYLARFRAERGERKL